MPAVQGAEPFDTVCPTPPKTTKQLLAQSLGHTRQHQGLQETFYCIPGHVYRACCPSRLKQQQGVIVALLGRTVVQACFRRLRQCHRGSDSDFTSWSLLPRQILRLHALLKPAKLERRRLVFTDDINLRSGRDLVL